MADAASPTYSTPRPDWVRRLNAIGEAAGGAERLIPFDVDFLVAQAQEATGLSDFGDFDGDWRSRLDGLVAAMETSGRLHATGRVMVRGELQRCLRARLLMAEARRAKPTIAQERIEAPIVVTGPGRSGTSILFELLCLDPKGHGPLAWESSFPALPPENVRPDGSPDLEPLLRMAEAEQDFWEDVNPVISTIHEHRSYLPVECIVLQMPSFATAYWWIVANLEGWIPDMMAAMQYHRAALQTIQHGREPFTWFLKTPIYLAMIDLLFATYPDAWVVRTPPGAAR